MQLLRAATLTVADVGAAVSRYTEWLDYRLVERGPLDPGLARAWDAPAAAGRDHAVLRPASGEPVFIRFVQAEPPPDYRPLRTYGWAATELCVTDVLAVQERMRRSPFAIIGPAKEIDGLPTIFPMQVRGPDQEIVFLTQVRGDLPEYDLPRARSLIDRPFIMVLAASDLDASSAWLAGLLALSVGRSMDIPYSVLSQAFGTPPDVLYTLLTLSHERDVFVEVDQYPPETVARPVRAGDLPPGVALVTFAAPTPPASAWIAPPVAYPGTLYEGARAATARGPDGTLAEILLPGH